LPARVYTVRFLAARPISVATADAARFTVPAGKVAIVRSVAIFTDTPGCLLFGIAQPFDWAHFVSSQSAAQYTVVNWEGRHVVRAGEQMGCQWLSGAQRVVASGYLLDA
jgi:hypothetical protein